MKLVRRREVLSLHGGYIDNGADPNTREPRLFGVAERFTVSAQLVESPHGRLDPKPIACKPLQFYLSAGHVQTSAWQIHDIRVNGKSQLDGDELSGALFSPWQTLEMRSFVSGFDTIAIDGSLEIDVSFRGEGNITKVPFYAGLIGLAVNPDHDVTAYSGLLRLRGTADELVAATCDGPARVPPNACAWFIVKPLHQTIRPSRLAIANTPGDWLIEDLHINGQTQFKQADPLPGAIFHPGALDTFTSLDPLSTRGSLAIKVRYIGSNPRGGRFSAVMHGSADVPNKQRSTRTAAP